MKSSPPENTCARRGGRNLWIVGPRYDLIFFSTVWFPPLLILAYYGAIGIGWGAGFFLMWIYHLFIRLPHFMASFGMTYFRPEQRAHYKQHWIVYYAVPALILLVYGALLILPQAQNSLVRSALIHMAAMWGYQHIGMQNYGILRIYQRRSGHAFDAVGLKFEKTIFYSTIVAIWAEGHLVPVFFNWFGASGLGNALKVVDIGILYVLAFLITLYLWRLWTSKNFTWPAMMYFVVSLIVMVKWPFYDSLPRGSWFLVFNGHHSIAYLGLLFLVRWNRKGGGPLTFTSGLSEYLRYLVPLIGLSFIMVLGNEMYAEATGLQGYNYLELLTGFFVLHYYLESVIWRSKNPHSAKTIFPLLNNPQTGPGVVLHNSGNRP